MKPEKKVVFWLLLGAIGALTLVAGGITYMLARPQKVVRAVISQQACSSGEPLQLIMVETTINGWEGVYRYHLEIQRGAETYRAYRLFEEQRHRPPSAKIPTRALGFFGAPSAKAAEGVALWPVGKENNLEKNVTLDCVAEKLAVLAKDYQTLAVPKDFAGDYYKLWLDTANVPWVAAKGSYEELAYEKFSDGATQYRVQSDGHVYRIAGNNERLIGSLSETKGRYEFKKFENAAADYEAGFLLAKRTSGETAKEYYRLP